MLTPRKPCYESGAIKENGHGLTPHPRYESGAVTAKMTTIVIPTFLWKGC
jgi:hypothetical protein